MTPEWHIKSIYLFYTIIYSFQHLQAYTKILALSFRWGICEILVHDGPLFDTNTSHVDAGRLK